MISSETERDIDSCEGKGTGQNGGSSGDLVITIDVMPHPHLYRQGAFVSTGAFDAEAVLGAKIEIPTLSSSVRIQIPAGVRNGQKMRLRNRGIPKKVVVLVIYILCFNRPPQKVLRSS